MSSFPSRAWLVAATSLLLTAAAMVPLVLVSSRTTRFAIAVALGVAAAVGGLLVSFRLHRTEKARLGEGRRTRAELDGIKHKYQALVDALPLVAWLYEPGDRGSTLYVSPLIEATVGAVKVPVTLKMRLGWDDRSINAPELARRAAHAGVRLITVHARTRCQFYKGDADWKAVRAVRDSIRIPLVINGDIRRFGDAGLQLSPDLTGQPRLPLRSTPDHHGIGAGAVERSHGIFK